MDVELDGILVINAGSSSQKCSLFGTEHFELLWDAHLEWKENFRDAHLTASDIHGEKISKEITISSTRAGLKAIFESLTLSVHIVAVGHRVVHGGEKLTATTRITPEVKATIKKLSYLAPLHNPANLEGIECAEEHFGDLQQFAVFDTAFHATLPEEAMTYPVPYEWREKGIRRYGFHGISHNYC
ncbi:MAG: Acetate kinase, partial [Chlamydiae bacterium]|nr:Acetate kinase [Chlamydiota bacterium]